MQLCCRDQPYGALVAPMKAMDMTGKGDILLATDIYRNSYWSVQTPRGLRAPEAESTHLLIMICVTRSPFGSRKACATRIMR